MPAQFVVKKGSTGKYRFDLVAANGQVIATSEAYESRARALSGVESVRKNAANAVLVDGTAPAAKPVAKATKRTAATGARKAARATSAKPARTAPVRPRGKTVAKAPATKARATTVPAKAAKAVTKVARKVASR